MERLGRPSRWLSAMAAASAAKRATRRTRRFSRVRAPCRSRVKMSLQVWKIDSMRWRIGARWGPCPLFVFASRSGDRGVECFEVLFELCAAEVLVADQDQHLAGLALAARDHLQADEFLVDFWGGQRERPWLAVQREQGVQQ